jgi:hypothetical protein
MEVSEALNSRLSFLKTVGGLCVAGFGAAGIVPGLATAKTGPSDPARAFPMEHGFRYELVKRGPISPAVGAGAISPNAFNVHCCPTGNQCVINGTITGWAARCTDPCGTFFACRQTSDQACYNYVVPGC